MRRRGGAGPLSATIDGRTVAISAFSFGAPGPDRVGPYTVGANGSMDYTGQLTVTVSGGVSMVPEPGSVLLLATGMVGLGVVARRRRAAR